MELTYFELAADRDELDFIASDDSIHSTVLLADEKDLSSPPI